MTNSNTQIASYACLAAGFLFYLLAGYIRGFGDMDEHARDGYSRILIILSAVSIGAATITGASNKSVDTKDALNIVIVGLAITLVLVATWRTCGLLSLSLATMIAILASVQLVITS